MGSAKVRTRWRVPRPLPSLAQRLGVTCTRLSSHSRVPRPLPSLDHSYSDLESTTATAVSRSIGSYDLALSGACATPSRVRFFCFLLARALQAPRIRLLVPRSEGSSLRRTALLRFFSLLSLALRANEAAYAPYASFDRSVRSVRSRHSWGFDTQLAFAPVFAAGSLARRCHRGTTFRTAKTALPRYAVRRFRTFRTNG